jgi:phage tail protein X
MTTTIPAGWLPIESAPKDGTPVLLFARLAGVNFATNSPYAPTIHVGAYRTDLCIWTGSAYRDQLEIEIEPTHWMPRPAFPDCAAPGVSTVEDASFPTGAIVNGHTLADRLEAYPFESQGGDLRLCSDWVEFRRCFEYLAEWVSSRAPAAGDALDAARWRAYARLFPEISASFLATHAVDGVDPLPTIKGAAITGGYVVVTPAGWDADKTTKLRDAILRLFPVNPAHTPRPSDELAAQRKGDA